MSRLINLVKSEEIDIIKLIKASYSEFSDESKGENLFYNPTNLLFAIQPSIIRKNKLLNIYKHTKGNSIWEFEKNSNNLIESLNYSSCYYYEGSENKRGLFHWDSIIYPYVATAVVKGKWDYESYSIELDNLLSEYKIDPNRRGKNV